MCILRAAAQSDPEKCKILTFYKEMFCNYHIHMLKTLI